MTDQLCPGCPGDPNENCCKPELRVKVWMSEQNASVTTHQPTALPEFTDERVQSVYTLLCDEQASPPGEHWEGWVARRIVAALQSQPAAPGVTGAVQTLIETLKADPEYAWAWHCNVAMAAVDEGLSHYAANKAAARFLSWLAQIDTTTHPGFPKAPEQPANAGVFAKWWNTQGQSMQQHASESPEDFARRIAAWAWSESARSINPAQPAAAGVSDAEWWHEVLGSAGPDLLVLAKKWDSNEVHVYQFVNEAEKIVKAAAQRAILALRPQAVPMTVDQAWHSDTLMAANGIAGFKMDALMRIVRAVEAHHGITAPAGGEKQA